MSILKIIIKLENTINHSLKSYKSYYHCYYFVKLNNSVPQYSNKSVTNWLFLTYRIIFLNLNVILYS